MPPVLATHPLEYRTWAWLALGRGAWSPHSVGGAGVLADQDHKAGLPRLPVINQGPPAEGGGGVTMQEAGSGLWRGVWQWCGVGLMAEASQTLLCLNSGGRLACFG